MRRLIAILVAMAALAAFVTPAAAVPPTRTPANLEGFLLEGLCGFDVQLDVLVDRSYAVDYYDRHGNLLRTQYHGSIVIRLTNTDTARRSISTSAARRATRTTRTGPSPPSSWAWACRWSRIRTRPVGDSSSPSPPTSPTSSAWVTPTGSARTSARCWPDRRSSAKRGTRRPGPPAPADGRRRRSSAPTSPMARSATGTSPAAASRIRSGQLTSARIASRSMARPARRASSNARTPTAASARAATDSSSAGSQKLMRVSARARSAIPSMRAADWGSASTSAAATPARRSRTRSGPPGRQRPAPHSGTGCPPPRSGQRGGALAPPSHRSPRPTPSAG